MNFARALTTLARNSVLDPEPSYWAKQAVEELEAKFFAPQDDATEWTPAFRRSVAQWLDLEFKFHPLNRPANRNDDPAQAAVRDVMEKV